MERNGSAPKINPGDFEKQQWLCPRDLEKQLVGALRTLIARAGDLEKQLFGALRNLIAWAPKAAPRMYPFAMEIYTEMALPQRSTLGTSKNNFLGAFERELPGPGTWKNNFLEPFEPQLPGPQGRGPDIKRRTLPGCQNVTLRNGNMERNGSAPKINPGDFEKQQWLCPGDLEKQLFGALRTLIAWAPRAGAGRKGWGPYRAPLPGPRHLPDLVVHLLLVVAVVVIIMGCPVESPRQQSQVV